MDTNEQELKAVLRKDQESLALLLPKLRGLILEARKNAATAVNGIQVATNYEIGRLIVEQEQQGSDRAAYGAGLIKALSIRLADEFGKGFSAVNLSLMRKFYLTYRDRRGAAIFQTPSEISSTGLSWSHYVLQYPRQSISAISSVKGSAQAKTAGVESNLTVCLGRVEAAPCPRSRY